MPIYSKRLEVIRPAQGDIYRDVQAPFSATPITDDNDKELDITEFVYPYTVILSQECDLDQDFTNRQGNEEEQDKFLPSILFAPAYFAESLRAGDHLKEVGLKMGHKNSDMWYTIRKNLNLRYHYLKKDLNLEVPDLAIDFKHYFTISRDFFFHSFFNDKHYVASLNLLFREDLSNRFSHYLSRIGLPEIKETIRDTVQ